MSEETEQLDTPGWVTAVLDEFEKAGYFDEGDVAGHVIAAAKKIESPTDSDT
jgi:hypothetical protein